MITITAYTGATIKPALALGYAWGRESRTNVHPLVLSPYPAITVKPAAARKGTARLLFLTEADALRCEMLHSLGGVLVHEDTDRPGVKMSYVVSGPLAVELDPETRTRWVVSVDYQQVSA